LEIISTFVFDEKESSKGSVSVCRRENICKGSAFLNINGTLTGVENEKKIIILFYCYNEYTAE
jgi:hypothetical protein